MLCYCLAQFGHNKLCLFILVHTGTHTYSDIHTQAGTHKDTFSLAKKLSGAFFKQGYSSLLTEAGFRTGAGHL